MPMLMIDGQPIAVIEDEMAQQLKRLAEQCGGDALVLEMTSTLTDAPERMTERVNLLQDVLRTVTDIHDIALRMRFVRTRSYLFPGNPTTDAEREIARAVRGY